MQSPDQNQAIRNSEDSAAKAAYCTWAARLVRRTHHARMLFPRREDACRLKFGNGDVIRVEGSNLIVRFDKAGEKLVLARYIDHAIDTARGAA